MRIHYFLRANCNVSELAADFIAVLSRITTEKKLVRFYFASRGPSIFLDKSGRVFLTYVGRSKGLCSQGSPFLVTSKFLYSSLGERLY